jgi:hypothetical protein
LGGRVQGQGRGEGDRKREDRENQGAGQTASREWIRSKGQHEAP